LSSVNRVEHRTWHFVGHFRDKLFSEIIWIYTDNWTLQPIANKQNAKNFNPKRKLTNRSRFSTWKKTYNWTLEVMCSTWPFLLQMLYFDMTTACSKTDYSTVQLSGRVMRFCLLQNVELICSSQYGQTVASELFRVPVSVRRMKRLRNTTVGMHSLSDLLRVCCHISWRSVVKWIISEWCDLLTSCSTAAERCVLDDLSPVAYFLQHCDVYA